MAHWHACSVTQQQTDTPKKTVVDCRLVMQCIMILHQHVHDMLTCKMLVGATDTSSSVLYRVVVLMAA